MHWPKEKIILLILKPTHLLDGGKSRGNSSWFKSNSDGYTIIATPCGFSLQIQEEEPDCKKPELFALVQKS